MALLLVLLFLVAPIAELAVIVQVAGAIGVLDTIGLLIAVSIVGGWLAKHQGLTTLRRIQTAIAGGEMPSREVANGALILLAGALMIAPGFISDFVALLLLLPPTRAAVRRPLMRWLAERGRGRVTVFGPRGPRTRGSATDDVWDVESWEEPPTSAPARGELRGPA
ncbi:MAG TPA: FxsA family protein [Actinomycetota bacterium]|nr:FxsA family protein [Actinomycetota bacterium]